MSRRVAYRLVPKPWAPLQRAEVELGRVEFSILMAGWGHLDDCDCQPCRSGAADRLRATAIIRDCMAKIRALWVAQEHIATPEDAGLAEAVCAFAWGAEATDTDEWDLPEEGFRLLGADFGICVRFADSSATEEPEFTWVDWSHGEGD